MWKCGWDTLSAWGGKSEVLPCAAPPGFCSARRAVASPSSTLRGGAKTDSGAADQVWSTFQKDVKTTTIATCEIVFKRGVASGNRIPATFTKISLISIQRVSRKQIKEKCTWRLFCSSFQFNLTRKIGVFSLRRGVRATFAGLNGRKSLLRYLYLRW